MTLVTLPYRPALMTVGDCHNCPTTSRILKGIDGLSGLGEVTIEDVDDLVSLSCGGCVSEHGCVRSERDVWELHIIPKSFT